MVIGKDSGLREIEVDEPSVVARAQDGDTKAFELLVIHYQDKLLRVAMRLLRERGEAEDAVQEALIHAWRSLPKLADPERFGSWLYKLTTNSCMDTLRKKSRMKQESSSVEDLASTEIPESEAAVSDPALLAEAHSTQDELRRVVSELAPDLRTCWVLKELEGKSYGEIAEILDITPTVVRGRLSRARKSIVEGMRSWR